ncbi:HD-GYP domain-containing protein [bacterium]|nr:HD-GYP domain-containing protein [bacterium]MBU1152875.1 HD-GYP domain-containing protein [bacterium]MBU1782581.1 HD-GYP domain-containing protein [bacterium]
MSEDKIWEVKRIKYKGQVEESISSKKAKGPRLVRNKKVVAMIEEIPKVISKETKKEAIDHVSKVMEDIKYGRTINGQETKKAMKGMIKELTENKEAMLELEKIKEYDKYTFTHSLNVCILSLLIGLELRLSQDQLEELGVGALLHDVGKTFINNNIINKEEHLDSREYEEIKKHPLYSYKIISQDQSIGEMPKIIAYQHHERYNGFGYPQGLKDTKINKYAVMVSLGDVYDALIADRVYKRGLLPYEAMKIIIGSSGTDFDPNITSSFVRCMSIYPSGSLVRLNTGEIAMVVKVSKQSIIRPFIRIVLDSQGEICKETIEIDLMKDDKHFIIGAVDVDIFSK